MTKEWTIKNTRLFGRQVDAISVSPKMDGRYGRAWEIDRAGLRTGPNDNTIGWWLIEAPYAHPFWHSYSIVLFHLQCSPDGEPLQIRMPGATHEFALFTLDPNAKRDDLLTGKMATVPVLHPANFIAQMRCPSHEAAKRMIELAAASVCDGRLNPDTDHRSQWIEIFGSDGIKPEYR
ncbi:MAG: hypothetical protein GC190_19275 [Alphaproteobacteria bacterium]|nr:hypothetical protein [Alphaproteobacteria bacterium]